MSAELITDIGELTTVDAQERVLKDAAVVIEDGRIAWIGAAADAPEADVRTSVEGRAVLPGWVDSHTHLVFAGDRSAEFEARMAGESYAAGGINVTTEATRQATDEQLRSLVIQRVQDAVRGGTTTLETKTGYGLSVAEEIRHARLLAGLRAEGVVDQVTFLGAHLVPSGAEPEDYVRDVVGPMLDGVREHVQWADVFCERGAFTQEQSRTVLTAAREAGLGLRVHGNQLGTGPGVRLAVELGAASVDHVNHLDPDDVAALAQSWSGWERGGTGGDSSGSGTGLLGTAGPGTVATCLPACDLSTREPLAPGRALLDAGVQIALASNCNPGTSYTSSMAYCVTTAVLQMHLTLAEAVRAATYGGALALRMQDTVGSLEVGKRADLQVLDAPAAIHLAYRPGMPLTHAVWRAGARVV